MKAPKYNLLAEFNVMTVIWRMNMRSAMALKVAFALQVFGMVLNDLAFVAVWLFFFNAVGTVNGWSGTDTIGLMGFSMLGFGLMLSFLAGSTILPEKIEQGVFDSFLLSPRNLFLRVISSYVDYSGLGDAVLGLVLLIIYAVLSHSIIALLLPLAFLPAAITIYISINVLCASIAFYVMDAQNVMHSIFKTFLMPTLLPSGLFPKGLKFFYTFIVPSLAVAGLPIEIVKRPNIYEFLLVYLIALGWLLICLVVFFRSIKRYESGNYIGIRG